MKTRIILSGLFFSLVLLTGIAHAGNGYMVFGGVNGFERFDAPGIESVDDPLGVQLRGGYRFNQYFALEGEWSYLPFDADLLKPAGAYQQTSVTMDSHLLMVNGRAIAPLGKVEPYATFGAGMMLANVRTSNTVAGSGGRCWDPYYGYYYYCYNEYYEELDNATEFVIKGGLGVDINLNRQWTITLESTYVKPYGDLSDLSYINFGWGIRYNFR